MKGLAVLILFFAMNAAQAQMPPKSEWDARGFDEFTAVELSLENDFYKNSASVFDKAFDLYFFLPKGGTWNEAALQVELQGVARVYDQCRIKVSKIWLVRASHGRMGINPIYNYDHDEERKELSAWFDLFPIKKRPLVFLADQLDFGLPTVNDRSGQAFSKRTLSRQNTQTSMIDSLFLFYHASQKEHGLSLARELGYLLGDTGDNELKYNLLSTTVINQRENSILTKEQCRQFRRSNLVYDISGSPTQ